MGECVGWIHMTTIIGRHGHMTLNEHCFGKQRAVKLLTGWKKTLASGK